MYVRPRPTRPAFSSVQGRRKEEREEWVEETEGWRLRQRVRLGVGRKGGRERGRKR